MTCKDCIHDMACGEVDVFRLAIMHNNKAEKYCKNFENKADFVKVVRCQKCAYREACNKEIYVEHSYTSIDWCSEGERRDT